MSAPVHVCEPGDTLGDAAAMIERYRVQQLPVVGEDGSPVGLLRACDLARVAAEDSAAHPTLSPAVVCRALAAIRDTSSAGTRDERATRTRLARAPLHAASRSVPSRSTRSGR